MHLSENIRQYLSGFYFGDIAFPNVLFIQVHLWQGNPYADGGGGAECSGLGYRYAFTFPENWTVTLQHVANNKEIGFFRARGDWGIIDYVVLKALLYPQGEAFWLYSALKTATHIIEGAQPVFAVNDLHLMIEYS